MRLDTRLYYEYLCVSCGSYGSVVTHTPPVEPKCSVCRLPVELVEV